MTTNPTIDGVKRATLANFIEYSVPASGNDEAWQREKAELRALLDAPAVEPEIPEYFVEACDKFDWTPEEALRFYADGKHFDVADGQTRILCTGAIASHALKSMGESYAEMKGIERAAQPQGEPVANNREQFEAWVLGRAHPVYGWLDKHWLLRGDNPENYADPYVQGLWVASQPLYAEQPAPVAVVLPHRKHIPDFTLHPMLHKEYTGWNAYDAEFRRLNPWLANDK